jgi:hypothetical protein
MNVKEPDLTPAVAPLRHPLSARGEGQRPEGPGGEVL